MTMIELFLSPGDEGGQTLRDGLGDDSLAHTGADKVFIEGFLDPGGDQQSLADQGWGVVIPKTDEGERLLELVAPLIKKRSQERGCDASIFRVKPGMNASQTKAWIDRKFDDNQEREDIPWYILILGQPTDVSLDFQRQMASSSLVGRLAFDRDRDYEAYVEKILAWEDRPPSPELARALFCTATDGTQATTMGHELLMQPTIEDAHARQKNGRFTVAEIVEIAGQGADVGDRLLSEARVETPSILFSCSHGMGAPSGGWSSSDRQRALQGAVCLGQGQHIAGDHLAKQRFLPGGLWFLFACFGAGTPGHSAYDHWLKRLKEHGEFGGSVDAVLASLPREGEDPFIAALPKAVLANPDGPLAVIGHLDLAWSYSFNDAEKFRGAERHRRFQGTLTDMARGDRLGFALRSLLAHRREVESELIVAADAAARAEERGEDSPNDDARLGHRWMLHQDLGDYILLGDPAARLPVDPAAVRAAKRRARKSTAAAAPATPPASASASVTTFASAPQSSDQTTPSAGPLDLATRVQIAIDVLSQKATPEALSGQYSVAREDIERWVETYDRAGRAALQALIDGD